MTALATQTCPHCGHRWLRRTETPRACPRCRRRLDLPQKKGARLHADGHVAQVT